MGGPLCARTSHETSSMEEDKQRKRVILISLGRFPCGRPHDRLRESCDDAPLPSARRVSSRRAIERVRYTFVSSGRARSAWYATPATLLKVKGPWRVLYFDMTSVSQRRRFRRKREAGRDGAKGKESVMLWRVTSRKTTRTLGVRGASARCRIWQLPRRGRSSRDGGSFAHSQLG